MVKFIALLIFKKILLFDFIVKKISNRKILPWIKNFIDEVMYTSIIIDNKSVKFFVPNQITQWRIDTFYSKEPETLDWIDTFDDSKETIFWDIGANIGLYSIYAAAKYKNIKIISFEPSTSNLRVLSRNISINNFVDKITINQVALCDQENKYLMMEESSFQEGGALNTFDKKIDYRGQKIVSVNTYKILGTTINYLLRNKILNIPNHIKIDVDGIEHFILNGADEFLNNPIIESLLIELNEEFKEQYDQVLSIMKKAGFKLKHKKHSSLFDNISNHSSSYNFIFVRV